MTRLSARQRRVLSELAHMRVPREMAILRSARLAVLIGASWHQTRDSLVRLEKRGLVERHNDDLIRDEWRITDAGRDAL